MVIGGVALLAACTLVGAMLGDLLGAALGVKANVGGVGIAMLLLIVARLWLDRRGYLNGATKLGIAFWGALYIPIVVAMAAQQNVVVAISGGPMVLLSGSLAVAICFAAVGVIARFGGPFETMDEIEAAEAGEAARRGVEPLGAGHPQ